VPNAESSRTREWPSNVLKLIGQSTDAHHSQKDIAVKSVQREEIEGRQLTPDEIQLLEKYRELVLPARRLAGYDDFAKWLFTTAAVVGTLGAALPTPPASN